MIKNKLNQALLGATVLLAVALLPLHSALACTRAVYLGPEDTVITVRNMDWKTDLGSNLWAFPRGMERDGAAGPTLSAGLQSTGVWLQVLLKQRLPTA
jgi:choloylglycine hydrolase